jgi:hypothetical protein
MSDLANNIMRILDMEEEVIICPTVDKEETEETSNVPAVVEVHTKESDVEFARNNIRDMIYDTRTSIDELSKIAKDSESARAYEVLSQFIQTFTELNKDLIESYPEVKDAPPVQQNTTNNIDKAVVFTGSTADLAEIVKKQVQNANNIPKQS